MVVSRSSSRQIHKFIAPLFGLYDLWTGFTMHGKKKKTHLGSSKRSYKTSWNKHKKSSTQVLRRRWSYCFWFWLSVGPMSLQKIPMLIHDRVHLPDWRRTAADPPQSRRGRRTCPPDRRRAGLRRRRLVAGSWACRTGRSRSSGRSPDPCRWCDPYHSSGWAGCPLRAPVLHRGRRSAVPVAVRPPARGRAGRRTDRTARWSERPAAPSRSPCHCVLARRFPVHSAAGRRDRRAWAASRADSAERWLEACWATRWQGELKRHSAS